MEGRSRQLSWCSPAYSGEPGAFSVLTGLSREFPKNSMPAAPDCAWDVLSSSLQSGQNQSYHIPGEWMGRPRLREAWVIYPIRDRTDFQHSPRRGQCLARESFKSNMNL